ncbi:MAG: enoyl-CoA hydratase-related protein [Actinomycetota bacterium]|nr:enoyl-CoA hydratase-related protein [Actinomycetota bacterium]
MTDAPVRIEAVDGVLRITLDRPSHKNSLTPTSVRTIIEALEPAAHDDTLRVVLLTSSGDDFCSGADIVASNPSDGDRPRVGNLQRRTAVQAHRLIEVLTTIQLPVVGAVRGWAAGLGCQLALAADFTVAADDATFWEPFVSRGFTPDSGATWLLPRLVGVARAKELLLLGEQISGRQAAEWGMIHRAVPADEVATVAESLVTRLAAGPTVAIGLTKHAIHRSLELSMTDAMANEAMALELSSRSPDFREGLAAFKERRDPSFGGR